MKRLALALFLVACDKDKPPPPAPPPVASAAALVIVVDSGAPPMKLEKLEMAEIRIREGAVTTVTIAWLPPPGTAINDDAPFHVRWNRSDGIKDAPPDQKTTGSAIKDGYTMKVQPLAMTPNATLAGAINIVVCDAVNHSIYLPVRRRVELGFTVVKDGPTEVRVEVPLPAAK